MSRKSYEQYLFEQDSREKKNVARGARHTRTHCGKGGSVKFPSDYLTEKERKAMNGKVESYRMNDPMTWKEFKRLPDDLKVNYVKALRNKYNVPDNALAAMFGIAKSTLCGLFTKIGLSKGSWNGAREWDEDGFDIWRGKAIETDAVLTREDIEKIMVKDDTPEIGSCDNRGAVPDSGTLTFEGKAGDIMRSIKDILRNRYVRLSVQWSVTDEPDVAPILTMDTEGLAKAAAVIDYAVINNKRREAMGTKG